MTKQAAVTPESILARSRPDVRALAEALRTLIRTTIPSAEERAYPGWGALGYRDEHSGYFCGIFPGADEVRLAFEHGAALADPDGLLTGNTKQVRYVVMRPGERIPRAGIVRLLNAAIAHGAVR